MPQSEDPRKKVGARVQTKAKYVLNHAQCKRLFGIQAETKFVQGVVQECVYTVRNQRRNCSIRATWYIMDREVDKSLSIRNIQISNSLEQTAASTINQDSHEQPPEPEPRAEVVCHGTVWSKYSGDDYIGDQVHMKDWTVLSNTGEQIREGGDNFGPGLHRKLIEYFLIMLPHDQLMRMVRLTSEQLIRSAKAPVTVTELLRFFGIVILCTRYEFGSRSDLWKTRSNTPYIEAPNFGSKTGMCRSRFDSIWQCLRFSEQSELQGSQSSVAYRWSLVSDFVESINRHRTTHVTPSEIICADESICRWYGQGGAWIDIGLPMYVAIDRKPENGCEIQNSACGKSGIMLRLKLVTTAEDEASLRDVSSAHLPHGTIVLQQLVSPWSGTNRIVCADSYFASVTAAETLKSMGLKFIGVVKTSTKKYPMATLASLPVTNRGDQISYVNRNSDGTLNMMALLWVDRERRYFICTASSAAASTMCERIRWRQTENGPQRVLITVPQPKAVDLYYSACAAIDKHNRCRQDDLGIERKLVTMDWSKRVGLSLLSMIVVDSWLLYNGSRAGQGMKQRDFYENLASELIGNVQNRTHQAPVHSNGNQVIPISLGPQLVSTILKKPNGQSAQRKCVQCPSRSIWVCSHCRNMTGADVFLCPFSKRPSCFESHVRTSHSSQ